MCPLAFLFIVLWIEDDPYYCSWRNLGGVSHSRCANQRCGHSPARFQSELAWSCSPSRLSLDAWACLIPWIICPWVMQWHWVLVPFLLALSLVDLAVVYALLSGAFFWTSHEFSMPRTQVLHVCKFLFLVLTNQLLSGMNLGNAHARHLSL